MKEVNLGFFLLKLFIIRLMVGVKMEDVRGFCLELVILR